MTSNTTEGKVLQIVCEFAEDVANSLGTNGVYLFGSLAYRDGVRFNADHSDVDLAVVIPESVEDPVARSNFIRSLLQPKVRLELKLAASLSRSTANSVCSLMAITSREAGADIHKDGAEGFFSFNTFQQLPKGSVSVGFPLAAKQPIADRLMRQCYRFAQKKRHSFLNVAANQKGSLAPFSDDAPLPKDVLRHAAMAASIGTGEGSGEEYDTNRGLGKLLEFLSAHAKGNTEYTGLHEWLLEKINHKKGVLDPESQLLLSELIWQFAEDAYTNAVARARSTQASQRRRSVEYFNQCVGNAFPGKRGIYWVTESSEIELRLTRMFANLERNLIWWFRGFSNCGIDRFESLGNGVYLFGNIEAKVSRLALCDSSSYAYHFVYVECEPLAPSGAYEASAQRASEATDAGRTYLEEYGLTDDGMIITREEFDDGAAERNGKIVDTAARTTLRCRYLTRVNFLLCGQMSPINNNDFDHRSEHFLARLLNGEDVLSELYGEVQRLRRHRDD